MSTRRTRRTTRSGINKPNTGRSRGIRRGNINRKPAAANSPITGANSPSTTSVPSPAASSTAVDSAIGNSGSGIDASASSSKPSFSDGASITEITSPVLDGQTDIIEKVLKRSSDPVLMLPMRLEYKVVNVQGLQGSRLKVTKSKSSQQMAAVPKRTSNLSANFVLKDSPLTEQRVVVNEKQIWFRWFPDDAFAKSGISAIEEQEQLALDTFKSVVDEQSADWFDTQNSAVMDAWQQFAGQVGVSRAVYLMRNSDVGIEDSTEQLGKILALPGKIALFYSIDKRIFHLADGKNISEDVRYTPKSLEPAQWLTDFDEAISKGMGLKLSANADVANALNAEWIIAVGISASNQASEVKDFLQDAVANGEFSFLEQDSPTNNSDTEISAYESNPNKLIDALAQATHAENNNAQDEDADANGLASILGIDADMLQQAPDSHLTGRKNAELMTRCMLPCLMSSIYEWPEVTGFTKKELIEFISTYAYARGPLPAVRFKHNPYGILPILTEEDEAPNGDASDAEVGMFSYMKELSSAVMSNNRSKISDIPVIEPNDPDVSDKLAEILQLYAVSKRTDIAEVTDPDADAKALKCPLVESDEHKPADYLNDLRSKSLDALADPDYRNQSWPLLYRVLRYALSVVSDYGVELNKSTPSAGGIASRTARRSARIASRRVINPELASFKSALAHLSTLSTSELEVLMIEVFDLMYYRADAWKTALAYYRITKQREKNSTGLLLGYYGFLSRLRETSATADTDGYIQAPGLSQTVTAGVLRSASLRFGDESAFNMDLSSRRVRKALGMLALLRQGITLSEVLGHKIERWLHDTKNDILIHELRAIYPLFYGSGSKQKRPDVFDGIALAEGDNNDFSALDSDLQIKAENVRKQAQNDLDAVSDLITAEAVHQLTNGNSGAANAWMQVLSGEPVPSRVSFTRTQRDGQGSTHRVSYVLAERHFTDDELNPRIIAEPALEQMALQIMPGFNACKIRIYVYASPLQMSAPIVTKIIKLNTDLGLNTIDLVIGGKNELMVRARRYITRLWREDEELIEQLGPLPDADINSFIHKTHPVVVDLSYGRVKAEILLEKAGTLRKVTNKARALSPSDMNAGAAAAGLSETDIIEYLSGGIDTLVKRAELLESKLAEVQSNANSQFGTLETHAREIIRLDSLDVADEDLAENQAEIESHYQHLELARTDFNVVLNDMSRYSVPEALRPIATEELIDTIDSYADVINALTAKLKVKQDKLTAALTLKDTTLEGVDTYQSQQEAEAVLNQLISAIQYSTDGDAQPVWPPFTKNVATSPDLEAAPATTDSADPAADEDLIPSVDAHLSQYQNIRPALSGLIAYLENNNKSKGWFTKKLEPEVDPDADPEDVPSEEERPLSQYYGLYLGGKRGPLASPVSKVQQICGFVVDEWSEFKPSSIQNTGLAVNYDTPQNEAPHAMLLAVPKAEGSMNWDNEKVAKYVAEAIDLMQYRALPSEEAAFHKSGAYVFDVLPHIINDDNKTTTKRIPTVDWKRVELDPGSLGGLFSVIDKLSPGAQTAATLNERKTRTNNG